MLSFVLAATLAAPRLAAPPWSAVDVTPEKAEFFSGRFVATLNDRGVQVISSQDIAMLLGVERQRQLLGCSDSASSCNLELANALGAELVLMGSIARLDATYQVTVRVLRSSDGQAVAQALADGPSQEQLLRSLDDAARSLAAQLGSKPAAASGRSFAWVAFVGAGVFALGAGVSLGLAFDRSAALDRALVPGATREAVEAIARAGTTFEVLAWTGAGLAAASALTGVLLLALAPSPAAVTVGLAPSMNGGSVALRGVW